MGLLSSLLAPAVGETVKNLGDGIGNLAVKLRTAITGVDVQKRAELEKLITELEFASKTAQIEVNKIEAQHANIFISGARPFIIWVCGISLAYHYILNPFLTWIIKLVNPTLPDLPVVAMTDLNTILLALLGLGSMRSFEKIKKVENRH